MFCVDDALPPGMGKQQVHRADPNSPPTTCDPMLSMPCPMGYMCQWSDQLPAPLQQYFCCSDGGPTEPNNSMSHKLHKFQLFTLVCTPSADAWENIYFFKNHRTQQKNSYSNPVSHCNLRVEGRTKLPLDKQIRIYLHVQRHDLPSLCNLAHV